MNLPHRNEVSHCYEMLEQGNAAYRQGFQDLRRAAEGSGAIEERLDAILKEHSVVLIRGKEQPPLQPWREEDVYLCCLYDLLEALLTQEAEQIVAGPSGDPQKKKSLDRLLKLLRDIPFESPKWKEGMREEIKMALQKIRSRI